MQLLTLTNKSFLLLEYLPVLVLTKAQKQRQYQKRDERETFQENMKMALASSTQNNKVPLVKGKF